MHDSDPSAERANNGRYTVYLIGIALAGLTLASYDYNLLVLAIPDIARELDLSASLVGLLIFFIAAAQLVVTLVVGYALDIVGRRRMWMLCLCAAALFTGLTYFVESFWQLVLVRMLASSLAQAEFGVSTTIVNEEIPPRRRGMLYAIVQAGMLLLVSAGIGVLFYLLGGLLGERWGCRQVLIGTALLVPPLNLLFLLAHEHAVLVVVYFLIYQVTNGTWSGAGYAYQAESFPPRVRGTAVGFLGAMFVAGILLGASLWTLLMSVSTPGVTWLVIAVGAAFGQWLTIFLRQIPPGMTLEEIAT